LFFISFKSKDKDNHIIPIAYATDNNYTYPTLVSITSLLENIKHHHKTFYDIYIMLSTDFTEKNNEILKSVQNLYPNKCSINFINMGNLFSEQKTFPITKYYRLALHEKLPHIDKIIYLDGDTIIFEDLTDLINLDMKEYYILGFLDNLFWALEMYKIRDAIVLNTGVLLMDLKALRDFNATEKFREFMNKYNNSVVQEDQTIINVVLQKYINKLPPKYGIWGFDNKQLALEHNKIQRPKFKYNNEIYKKAFDHPAIVHFTGSKPFNNKNAPYYLDWWNYAKKTKFYDKIYEHSLN
jgi:lipopolysaccharide biosynthesis glycosyltransferase